MTSGKKPIYLTPPGDPLVECYRQAFEMLARPDIHTFTMTVHEELVKDLDVAQVQQTIMALQHYPHLIEKMIFAINFNFTEVEDSELYLPEDYWKFDGKYYAWFHKMYNLPIIIFFLNDEDSRFYALTGDMLAKGELPAGEPDRSKRAPVLLDGKNQQIIHNRIFSSAWMMLLYCHNTGFNPEPYIQSLLADLDVSEMWDAVYKKYQEDVKKGVKIRAVGSEDEL